jgi:GTPase SAR1 family protein
MGKCAVFLLGPAGVGKSTLAAALNDVCIARRRSAHLWNLDPGADSLPYEPSLDVRLLIETMDVQEEMGLGPNGALVFAMQYLVDNKTWWHEMIDEFMDDFLIIDCPGQIEVYTHMDVMPSIVKDLQDAGYKVCSLHLLDSTFTSDVCRFMSGTVASLSSMIRLELPHINVMTKMDLMPSARSAPIGHTLGMPLDDGVVYVSDDDFNEDASGFGRDIDKFLHVSTPALLADLAEEVEATRGVEHAEDDGTYQLAAAIGEMLDDFSMVSYHPLDLNAEASVEQLLSLVDHLVQFDEDREPAEPAAEEEIDW